MKRVIVLPAYRREMEIGTLVVLLKPLGDVVVIDNGSDDETTKISNDLGATVIKLRERQGWRYLLRRIKRLVKETRCDQVVIYDPKDRVEINDLKKVLSRSDLPDVLLLTVKNETDNEEGNPFHIRTWIIKKEPVLKMNFKGMRISPESEIVHQVKKNPFTFEKVTVRRTLYKKKKLRRKRNFTLKGLPKRGLAFIRNHPLSFWGSLGIIVLFLSLAFGVMTIDYFYKNQRLNYILAGITVVLAVLSGVFLFTGLILNAFSTLRERVDSLLRGMAT